MPIQRRLLILLAAAAFVLVTAAPTLACEPYTWADDQDGYRLSHGVQWAFSGEVVEEVPNPEVPDRPTAFILEVRDAFVGDMPMSSLRIEQDDGCDGFWYQVGDRVIAAIGRGPGLSAPFSGITNYQVAVWVIRDGKVDATVRAPWIAGRSPQTERQLRAELADLPDTATADAMAAPATPSAALPLLALAAILTAMFTSRRIRRPRDGA
jgi:hypothetical protein